MKLKYLSPPSLSPPPFYGSGRMSSVSKICTKDGAFLSPLFVTISGNYTLTFSSAFSIFNHYTRLGGEYCWHIAPEGAISREIHFQKVSKILSLYSGKWQGFTQIPWIGTPPPVIQIPICLLVIMKKSIRCKCLMTGTLIIQVIIIYKYCIK